MTAPRSKKLPVRKATTKKPSPIPKRAGPGQPTDYTPEIADQICLLVADRSNLHQIAQRKDMPCRTTMYAWLKVHPEFKRNYEMSRLLRGDSRADHIDDIVRRTLLPKKIKITGADGKVTSETDNPDWLDPQAARVAIDAEKWQAGKENPKRYGDRVAVTGANGGPLQTVALDALKGFTDEELNVLERAHDKFASIGDDPSGEEA